MYEVNDQSQNDTDNGFWAWAVEHPEELVAFLAA